MPETKAEISADVNSESVLAVLSKRELEVVDLIAGGYSNGDIAKMLFISVHTVNDHTKNIPAFSFSGIVTMSLSEVDRNEKT